MASGGPAPHGFIGGPGASGPGYPAATYDATGQVAPPGMKPRVTATLWEDEGSMCFQVEAKGVCVARRDGTISRVQEVHPHRFHRGPGLDRGTRKLTERIRRQPYDQRHQAFKRGGDDPGAPRRHFEE